MISGVFHPSDIYTGLGAGLLTSVLWTFTSLFFTAASRRLGATRVNALRIVLAIVLLAVTHRLLAGGWLPDARVGQILLLAASGVVGLAIGDQALFTAFVRIGPRLAMLIMTTAPLFAVVFGWAVLGERLAPMAWIGVGLTVAGVAWAVLERPRGPASEPRPHPSEPRPEGSGPDASVSTPPPELLDAVAYRRVEALARGSSAGGRAGVAAPGRGAGLALAFGAAACQAGGLLLSKVGIGHGWLPVDEHLSPQAATLLRMSFAAVGMLPILWIYGRREKRRRRAAGVPGLPAQWRRGVLLATCGAIVGPYLGVWMSLVAADRAPLGVAQTLCSLSPVLILPVARLVYDERVSGRAVLGAIVAVAGVGTLFWGAG